MKIFVVVAFVLVGCGKDDKSPGRYEDPKPPTIVELTELPGLVVDIPATIDATKLVELKGVGDATGWQTPDETFLVAVTKHDAPITPADFRASQPSVHADDWRPEKTFSGGWSLTYAFDRKMLQGDEVRVVGTQYGLIVHREIDKVFYQCKGVVPTEQRATELLKTCKSLRKKQ